MHIFWLCPKGCSSINTMIAVKSNHNNLGANTEVHCSSEGVLVGSRVNNSTLHLQQNGPRPSKPLQPIKQSQPIKQAQLHVREV